MPFGAAPWDHADLGGHEAFDQARNDHLEEIHILPESLYLLGLKMNFFYKGLLKRHDALSISGLMSHQAITRRGQALDNDLELIPLLLHLFDLLLQDFQLFRLFLNLFRLPPGLAL